MSYIVTARKWRPQYFRDVIGQKHVTETLQNAIKSGKIGHAYLFSGPRGIGKTTVARIFAKALNCVHGPAEEPCNACELCISIQSGTSIDVKEMDGASHNSVDDARELNENIGYYSSLCRYKIYIIDEVHMLSTPAFNALLKTLEEPPPGVIFIFATTEPQKIIPTILSRCQRYDFRRLSVLDIAGKLRMIAEKDGIAVDDASTMLIAKRATGAMRDAESILEQLKASRGSMITVSDVNEVLGIADQEVFSNIIDRCHNRDAKSAVELFTDYYDAGGDLKEFVEGLLGRLRDLLYARFEGGLDHVFLPDDLKARLKEQSGWFEQNDIIRMIGYVTDVESSLAYAVLPVLRIEVALARMATMETTIELKELYEKLGRGTVLKTSVEIKDAQIKMKDTQEDIRTAHALRDGGADEHETTIIQVQASVKEYRGKHRESGAAEHECISISPDIDSIKESWNTISSRVGAVSPPLGPSLFYAAPLSFDKDTLTVAFNPNDEFYMKTMELHSGKIGEIIGALLGMKIKVKCIVKRSRSVRKKGSGIDDLIVREPIVKDIIDSFDIDFN